MYTYIKYSILHLLPNKFPDAISSRIQVVRDGHTVKMHRISNGTNFHDGLVQVHLQRWEFVLKLNIHINTRFILKYMTVLTTNYTSLYLATSPEYLVYGITIQSNDGPQAPRVNEFEQKLERLRSDILKNDCPLQTLLCQPIRFHHRRQYRAPGCSIQSESTILTAPIIKIKY
jgi:hypothetical protein